jgi:hypothetical protein
MVKVSNLSTRFWSTDTNLSAILIFLFLVIFLFYPLYDIPVFRLITKVIFLLVLVSGCSRVLRKRSLGIGVVLLVAAYLLLNRGDIINESAAVSFWDCLISFFFCSLLAVIIMAQVFKEGGRITINHIQSAVAIYLLLGMMWGFLYQAIALKDPGAFVGASSIADSVYALKKDLIYYSFTTLTTVGYGDIMPVHPGARMLAVLEAIVGQLFPTILITWLVSMQILHSRREEG